MKINYSIDNPVPVPMPRDAAGALTARKLLFYQKINVLKRSASMPVTEWLCLLIDCSRGSARQPLPALQWQCYSTVLCVVAPREP